MQQESEQSPRLDARASRDEEKERCRAMSWLLRYVWLNQLERRDNVRNICFINWSLFSWCKLSTCSAFVDCKVIEKWMFIMLVDHRIITSTIWPEYLNTSNTLSLAQHATKHVLFKRPPNAVGIHWAPECSNRRRLAGRHDVFNQQDVFAFCFGTICCGFNFTISAPAGLMTVSTYSHTQNTHTEQTNQHTPPKKTASAWSKCMTNNCERDVTRTCGRRRGCHAFTQRLPPPPPPPLRHDVTTEPPPVGRAPVLFALIAAVAAAASATRCAWWDLFRRVRALRCWKVLPCWVCV